MSKMHDAMYVYIMNVCLDMIWISKYVMYDCMYNASKKN